MATTKMNIDGPAYRLPCGRQRRPAGSDPPAPKGANPTLVEVAYVAGLIGLTSA